MSDTKVTLDDFEFRDFEVPEEINFGGDQAVDIKRLIGGTRIVDAMGADDDPLEWSGMFRGEDALDRARQLDAKRRAGRALSLTYGELAYTVVIESFKSRYQSFYEIPYRISLVIISDDAEPAAGGETVGVDEMVLADMVAANELRTAIPDAPLGGLMDTLSTAVGSVGSFAGAGLSTISGVLSPLAAVQDRVGELLNAAETALGSVQAVGSVIPGLSAADLSSGLLGQVYAARDAANLFDLQSVLGRMEVNLGAIGTSGGEFITAGADLFALASKAYGDASEWSTIARANGLTDPIVQGVQTLLIPPTPRGDGGVLGE